MLAVMYADGRGVPRDEQKALALNERVRAKRAQALEELDQCDAGDCQYLKAVTQYQAPARDSMDAMEQAQLAPDLATQKCDGGDLESCIALINAFNGGRLYNLARVAEFRRKAAALLETQCNTGNADACDGRAWLLIDLGASERAQGLAILDRRCSLGRLGACMKLAEATADPEQKASAWARALPLQEALCTTGDREACEFAARR